TGELFNRPFNLTITRQPGIFSVSPSTTFSASATLNSMPANPTFNYTLTNSGSSPIAWTAEISNTNPIVQIAWLSLSSTGGFLEAGTSVTITATINDLAKTVAA